MTSNNMNGMYVMSFLSKEEKKFLKDSFIRLYDNDLYLGETSSFGRYTVNEVMDEIEVEFLAPDGMHTFIQHIFPFIELLSTTELEEDAVQIIGTIHDGTMVSTVFEMVCLCDDVNLVHVVENVQGYRTEEELFADLSEIPYMPLEEYALEKKLMSVN